MKKTALINYQEKWKEEKVVVKDLVLDVKNIRLDAEHATQDEVINDLFLNEDAMSVLESICQSGYFPDEPPVVIKENDAFTVLEGNRRVVALKALISPKIAPAKFVSKIERLMEGRLPIETINVHIATSRDEAMEYLSAKHTKTTRKQWSALRRAYFYYAQKEQGQSVEKLIERYKGVDIPEYIRMYEMHRAALSLHNISEDIRKKISNKGVFNISTLERFYSDKHIQNLLGIDFDKVTGEAKIPVSDSFDKVYSRVVTDISLGIATSRKELSKEGDRKKYINSVVAEVLEGKDLEKGEKQEVSKIRIPKKAPHLEKRNLVSNKISDTFESPGIGRVLWELQNIDYRKYPNATADTLRTFLEIVLKKYLEKTGGLPTPKKGRYIYLANVLEKMENDLTSQSNHRLVQVVQEIQKNKWYLDSINHNPDVFAVPDRVIEAWDQIQPLITFVFSEYKKNVEKDTL